MYRKKCKFQKGTIWFYTFFNRDLRIFFLNRAWGFIMLAIKEFLTDIVNVVKGTILKFIIFFPFLAAYFHNNHPVPHFFLNQSCLSATSIINDDYPLILVFFLASPFFSYWAIVWCFRVEALVVFQENWLTCSEYNFLSNFSF